VIDCVDLRLTYWVSVVGDIQSCGQCSWGVSWDEVRVMIQMACSWCCLAMVVCDCLVVGISGVIGGCLGRVGMWMEAPLAPFCLQPALVATICFPNILLHRVIRSHRRVHLVIVIILGVIVEIAMLVVPVVPL